MFVTINSEISERLNARREGEKGFTLVELLVVVIIIGILAAIAIPVFLNQREAAWRSSVESDLRNAALAVETFAAENNGSILELDSLEDDAIDFTPTQGNDITLGDGTDGVNSYTIVGFNADLGEDITLEYDSAEGGLQTWSDREEAVEE